MSELLKQAYVRLWPEGGAWTLEPDGDTEKLLEGTASFEDEIRIFYQQLAVIRDPYRTMLLDELEREYGFALNVVLTEDQRRTQIALLKLAKRKANGGLDFLKSKLDEAGFTNVNIYANDPPVNPEKILRGAYVAWCGNEGSCCGNEDTFCADITNGDFIVNGPIYKEDDISYLAGCGQDTFCGHQDAFCGNYLSQTEKDLVLYSILIDEEGPGRLSGGWALVFFAAASVTRDPITDKIVGIEQAVIADQDKERFIKLVLRYKPAQTWCAAAIKYELPDSYGYGFFPYGLSAFGV